VSKKRKKETSDQYARAGAKTPASAATAVEEGNLKAMAARRMGWDTARNQSTRNSKNMSLGRNLRFMRSGNTGEEIVDGPLPLRQKKSQDKK